MDILAAYLPHILTFGGSLAAALLVSGLRLFAIERMCRRFGIRLSDMEERVLQLRGKKAAEARWDQEKWNAEALRELAPTGKKSKYDNDPLE